MTNRPLILCVDDDRDDLEILTGVLLEMVPYCQIVEAANGRKALEYLLSEEGLANPPKLIILDMNMPVADGRITVSMLKDSPTTTLIPVVIFTTSSSPMDRDYCERQGVEMMIKPATYEELKRTVQRQLLFAGLNEF